jgi:tRNA:m(5)U-54 methyltransferase
MTSPAITVVGGGLAGCEVALQLARRGVPVRLHEMKPLRRTAAQTSDKLAELVCSNSFRSAHVANAIGLLKWEMRHTGSAIMAAADLAEVPAGDALAVDRDVFADPDVYSNVVIVILKEIDAGATKIVRMKELPLRRSRSPKSYTRLSLGVCIVELPDESR